MIRPLPLFSRMNALCRRFFLLWGTLFLAVSGVESNALEPRRVGDINNDGELSVVDLTLLRRHVRGLEELSPAHQPFADVNQDGVVNEDDARALIRLLTGEDSTRSLPLTGIRETSPSNGEESVSSSRRTGVILRFAMPVQPSESFHDRSVFGASVNGALLNSRAELSSDGRKLVLFVTDKIPGNARVDVSLNTAGIKDLLDREIDGDGDGQPGGIFKFYYLTESLLVVPNTEIKGKVFASERVNGVNVPLAGVIVRVAGTETAQVRTDANGAFTLPCPAGRFFAEVDGRKVLGENAFPDNAYYPYVVKAWEAVAGSKENLAVGTGEIFLPLIPAGALTAVDPNKETKVQAAPSVMQANPNFAEISLSVPAGALRKEDGTSGGKVGMAPVPPDRLPEPLAPGLDFPLVITIQTDGAGTFDQPVAVKFPNLPDQNGNKLKAGEKTGLWSFNHDTGSWELQGPMTVTDDGNYVTTDPGVGVRQPGWHGVLPGSQGVGPKRAASAPRLPEGVSKEVAQALKLAAQSSLPVRDSFMTLGEMRSSAEDLEQISRLLQDLRSMLAGYDGSSEVPYWWSVSWLKQRIAKLKPSYDRILAGGSADLSAALGRIQPQLDTLKRYLNALAPFNQLAYSDGSYTWLSTQFADSNAALLYVLNSIQPYLDTLKAEAPLFSRTAFEDVSRALFPGFNEPALSLAQEMEVLAKFMLQMEPVSNVVSLDHSEQLRTVKLQMSDYLARAGALSVASGKLSKYGYIKVDAIGEPQRIRSNAAGDYRMVLPPDREFSVTFVDPKTLQTGAYVGISGWNGTVTDLYGPVLAPLQPNASDLVDRAYAKDTDGDKLADALEMVIGTDASKVDTDGDGASDYQEVTRGKNPLSGLAVGTGVIFAAAATKDFESTDVDAGNELLFVSEQRIAGSGNQGGVVVYSLESKTEPLRQAWLPVENPVYRVRYADTNLAILSLHENGVAVVDVSSPTSPVVKSAFPVQPGESVNSALLVGDILVLGVNDLNNGTAKIVLKDLASGETIREESAGGSVSDLVANGTVVYALSKGNRSETQWWYWDVTSAVYAGDVSRAKEVLPEGQRLFRTVTVREWEFSKSGGRLALAPGKLFYVYESGLTGLSLEDPLNPKLEGDVYKPESGFQLGWRHLLFDGSVDASNKMTFLVALGASGRGNPDEDGDVAVFQYGRAKDFGLSLDGLGDSTPIAQFVTQFDSRAENPRQVNLASGRVYCMALAGGIVYAADKEQGLKVLNYRKYDSERKAPSLAIRVNSPSPATLSVPKVQAGGLLALTALPVDDVGVASVEWYVDGVRVAVTGGAPWGYTTRLPALSGGLAKRIKVEARVYDTGGNMTASESQIEVVEDPFPPAVLSVTPAASRKEVSSVSVTFNEPMDQPSLARSLTLRFAGLDGKLGTADDVAVEGGLISAGSASVTLEFSAPLPEGLYRAVLSGAVADVAGNALGSDYSWEFGVALTNNWLGGRGLWSDSAMWSSGVVPVAGEAVVFPAGAEPNVVVGGRAAFRPLTEGLVAGSSTFTRVLTKGSDGVVSLSGGTSGTSATPIYVGMLVTGSMVAEGTYVKSVTVTEDWSNPPYQTQTTAFELSQPLVEGIPGALPWAFTSGGRLDSVTVKGDTTLVDVQLELGGTLSLSSRLAFGGDSVLGVGTLTTAGSGALLSAAAVVDTGSLVAGNTHSGAARLKLTQPLLLSGSLALESAGFRDANGKLTTSRVELNSGLDLAGHELRIFGGYAGSVALRAPVGGGTFALTGPGKLAFDWKKSLLEEGSADSDKLLLRVSAGEVVLPKDVTLDVAGLGQVSFFATKLSNYGTVHIADQGWLKVYNYERVGDDAKELCGQDAVLEVLKSETGDDTASLFSSNSNSTFALKQDGSLWAWGRNKDGALGVGGSAEYVTAATQVGTDTDWKSVHTFYGWTFALKQNGSLWAWGYNYGGMLGVGSTEQSVTAPSQVGADTDWKSVNSFYGLTFALKQDGSIWAWGYNSGGALGEGSSAEYVTAATQVGTDTDWKSVNTFYGLNFALKQDGSLWAWGYNYEGRLGVGSSADIVTAPTQVGTDSDWNSVRTAYGVTFALKQDGSLWAWGDNWSGQLGLGSAGQVVTVPAQVGADKGWKSVITMGQSAYALKQDGSLWAWGNNGSGQLGLGSAEQVVTVPTQVGTDEGWNSVAVDDDRDPLMGGIRGGIFAQRQDGSLWAWGYNYGGILGVGSPAEYVTVPMQVGTATDWKSVSSSWGVTFAQKQDGSLWAWGYNDGGILGVGSSDNIVTFPMRVDAFADLFPPAIARVTPSFVRGRVSSVSVIFNEPMGRPSLAGSLTLRSAGPDGKLGTADDVAVAGGLISAGSASVTLEFPAPLPEGLYRAVLSGLVADVAGNALGSDYAWEFGVALTNNWLGGRGLWSDSAMWSYGAVPEAGDEVVFPAGAEPNVVVGGRAAFRPLAEGLIAGSSTFTRVLTTGGDGVVSVSGGTSGTSANPIYVGMLVTGSMVAEGTYVKSVKVYEDWSNPPYQTQTTAFELSQPLVEGIPGALPWAFTSGGRLDSVTVKGDTTLVDVQLVLSGTLSLSSRLAFGGDSVLGVGTLTTAGSAALLSAAAVVDTGSLVAGKTHSGAARLKLTKPLLLSGSLALESTGFRDTNGKLTTSRVELSSGLDLAGHELRIFGGYAGSVALRAPVASGTFSLTGPGTLAFDWKESLLDEENADWDKLSMKVTTGTIAIPEDVTVAVAGLGQVQFFADAIANRGLLQLDEQAWLKVYNYTKVGEKSQERLGPGAVLEKLTAEADEQTEGPVSSSGYKAVALKQDGSMWAWGDNYGGILGVGSLENTVNVPKQVGFDNDWRAVTSAGTFAVKQDGSLWGWGYNWGGQLGIGSLENPVAAPRQVGFDADWKTVSSSGPTFGLKQDGSLWAWGWNYGGGLGVGSLENEVTVPTQVGTDMDWSFVQSNGSTFALKQDGSLWAWGQNYGAALGVGSSDAVVAVPTQVGTDTDWKSVKSTWGGTFALKQDGSLWAWGGGHGVLGVGSFDNNVTVPTQVGTDTDWKSVHSGGNRTFALKQDGSLWAWGANPGGILGVGNAAETVFTPTQVGSDTDWAFVSTPDWDRVFALKRDGTLWAWGNDYGGSLGFGFSAETVTVPAPTQLGYDADWTSVQSVYGSNYGLKKDGSLWAWGRNYSGILGVGSLENTVPVPTQVGTDTDWAR